MRADTGRTDGGVGKLFKVGKLSVNMQLSAFGMRRSLTLLVPIGRCDPRYSFCFQSEVKAEDAARYV
jgi:hypothetical protein